MDITLVKPGRAAVRSLPRPGRIVHEPRRVHTAGAYVKTLTLKTTTVGPLRAAFGVPDGTRAEGRLNVDFDITKNLDDEQALAARSRETPR